MLITALVSERSSAPAITLKLITTSRLATMSHMSQPLIKWGGDRVTITKIPEKSSLSHGRSEERVLKLPG